MQKRTPKENGTSPIETKVTHTKGHGRLNDQEKPIVSPGLTSTTTKSCRDDIHLEDEQRANVIEGPLKCMIPRNVDSARRDTHSNMRQPHRDDNPRDGAMDIQQPPPTAVSYDDDSRDRSHLQLTVPEAAQSAAVSNRVAVLEQSETYSSSFHHRDEQLSAFRRFSANTGSATQHLHHQYHHSQQNQYHHDTEQSGNMSPLPIRMSMSQNVDADETDDTNNINTPVTSGPERSSSHLERSTPRPSQPPQEESSPYPPHRYHPNDQNYGYPQPEFHDYPDYHYQSHQHSTTNTHTQNPYQMIPYPPWQEPHHQHASHPYSASFLDYNYHSYYASSSNTPPYNHHYHHSYHHSSPRQPLLHHQTDSFYSNHNIYCHPNDHHPPPPYHSFTPYNAMSTRNTTPTFIQLDPNDKETPSAITEGTTPSTSSLAATAAAASGSMSVSNLEQMGPEIATFLDSSGSEDDRKPAAKRIVTIDRSKSQTIVAGKSGRSAGVSRVGRKRESISPYRVTSMESSPHHYEDFEPIPFDEMTSFTAHESSSSEVATMRLHHQYHTASAQSYETHSREDERLLSVAVDPPSHSSIHTIRRSRSPPRYRFATTPAHSTIDITSSSANNRTTSRASVESGGGGSWEKRFSELLEFKARFGHCDVPQSYKENVSLGIWVNKQRMEQKNRVEGRSSSLNNSRMQRLESAGFRWAKRKGQASWDEKFNELVAYKHRYGNCHVPTKYKANTALGRWVSTQRSEYKKYCEGDVKSSMTEEKIRRLEEIRFAWFMAL